MTSRLRAPLAALFALLIGGATAGRGLDALTDVPGFLFPYVFLFLAFELLRARRPLRDAEAFLVGAAVGLLHDGLYAKTLQDGGLPYGVDIAGIAASAFDWGMIAALSLHAADAVLPRREDSARPGWGAAAGAAAIAAGAAGVYVFKTATGRYRFERMLGDGWLVADVLFAAAAAALAVRAWRRAGEEEPPERDRGLWILAGVAAWLPGAQLIARLSGGPSGFFFVFAALLWTGGLGFGLWRLWSDRAYVEAEPRRASRPALGLALWRLAACAAIALIFDPAAGDPRAAGAFQVFVDLPSRLLFAWIFFTSRLAV